MILLAVAIALGVPILWALSVGALRDLRRARQRDPRAGCQAWVQVRGLGDRRYRCGEPRYADTPWCRRHEVARVRGEIEAETDARYLDEHQAAGRALAQARLGIPAAGAAVIGTIVLLAWLLQRGS